MLEVSAGISLRNGRVLLCQRKPESRLGLKWEFPGGKLEAGETPAQALERELREELNIVTQTKEEYVERMNEDGTIRLHFLFSTIIDGEPEAIDCNAFEWVNPKDLLGYDLAPTDRIVAELLARDGN